MRFWAFSAFQPWVTTWLKVVWPEATFRVPSSIFGFSTSMAPSKKTWALASSGEPANSSMLYGPFGFLAFMPSSRAWPWSWPTLKLSYAT